MSRQVFIEPHGAVPLASAVVVFRVGAATEPADAEGLARFALELARRGAGALDRAALDAELDGLGASLDVVVGADSMGVQAHGLARHLPRLVELIFDVLLRPRLDEAEAEALREETAAQLDELRDDDASLAGRFFDRAVFGAHTYGRSALGTDTSIPALDVARARAFLRAQLTRDQAIVGFAGAVDEQLAAKLGDTILAALPPGPGAGEHTPAVPAPASARRTLLIDKPARTQAQIIVGHPTPARAHRDWLPLGVASAIFGGTFTSRLMTEVRVKRGWSYGASARLGRGRHGSSFRLRVFPSLELAPQALELVLQLFDELCDKGVTDDEVRFVLGYLRGSYAFELATPADRLGKQLDAVLLGLPVDQAQRHLTDLAAIDAAQVNGAIRAHLRSAGALITLTGTASELTGRLASLPLGQVRVVPFDHDLRVGE